jgi:hypothetical protein
MLCSRCDAILPKRLVRNKKKGGGGSYTRPCQLRHCKHCGTWWQRDVNAAAALAKLVQLELLGLGRGKCSRGFLYFNRRQKGQSQAERQRHKQQQKRLLQMQEQDRIRRRQARQQQQQQQQQQV